MTRVPPASPKSAPSEPVLVVRCECGQEYRAPRDALRAGGRCTQCGRELKAGDDNARPAPADGSNNVLAPAAPRRIESLDQLRGYAIFGMIFVNWFGHFAVTPWVLDHQRDAYSYADTIAPLFIFVVGMGFRLSLQRRAAKAGLGAARWSSLKRYLTLFLIAILFYGPDYQKDWWDALTTIALAGVLSLPFIDKGIGIRAAAAFCYLGVYSLVFFGTGYGEWLYHDSMNGGPMGIFSGAFTLLFGTIAYDLLASKNAARTVRVSLGIGVGLIALAFAAWYLIPTDYNGYEPYGAAWPFAKRWSLAPFELLSTGLAFLAFLFFYWFCDMRGRRLPHLTILGENPLVIYLLQYALLEMNGIFLIAPLEGLDDAVSVGAGVYAVVGYVLFYLFCYAVARRLHRDNTIIKL